MMKYFCDVLSDLRILWTEEADEKKEIGYCAICGSEEIEVTDSGFRV